MQEGYLERINRAVASIEQQCGSADVGVILGTGLGAYAEVLENRKSISYSEIPSFLMSSVEGHAGRWHSGVLGGHRVCIMQGRFHAYEGHSMWDITLPVRVMRKLGVHTLVVTNAAGGANPAYDAGDLMLITDHINLSGHNPLTGSNLSEFGIRFPDMSGAYDKVLCSVAMNTAEKLGIKLHQGVYCWFNGPSYETPAEIRMAQKLGVDAVGMSTVPETIVAVHSGMRVMGVSCITNKAAGISDHPLNHVEVMEAGARAEKNFAKLLTGVISAL